VQDEVDVLAVKDCFPYGKVYVQLVQGGLEAKSGVRIKEMVCQLKTTLIIRNCCHTSVPLLLMLYIRQLVY
jgi:uncharacterized protein (TIGR02058 family)